jgi:endonuclease YncB( thermonuclease family)
MKHALMLLLACVFHAAQAEEFTAKIIVVIDGDTVLIRRAGGLMKIRLAEIDAPEKAQLFGDASKQSLSEMVLGKQVQVVSQAVDKYGRMVAHLSIKGLNVNAEQIRRGMAWEYFASSAASSQSSQDPLHSNQSLKAIQEEAKNAPRGLWVQSNPIPPWTWRKQHPNTWPVQSGKASLPHTPLAKDPTCGNKTRCSEMASCAEARHYFTVCGIKTLDGNGNGVPCEALCGSKVQPPVK